MNVALLEASLAETRRRLWAYLPRPEGRGQTLPSAAFSDAMDAAGYASALHHPQADIHSYLRAAVRAAVVLFSSEGLAHRGQLVNAMYAAVVVSDNVGLEALTSTGEEFLPSKGTLTLPVVDLYCDALSLALTQHRKDAYDSLVRCTLHEHPGRATQYWIAQAQCLKHWVLGERAAFASELPNAAAAFDQFYDQPRFENDPRRYLRLPVIGLTVLGARLESAV